MPIYTITKIQNGYLLYDGATYGSGATCTYFGTIGELLDYIRKKEKAPDTSTAEAIIRAGNGMLPHSWPY